MYPYRLVNDFAEIFSPTERQALEQKLLAYNDSTSTQLYEMCIRDRSDGAVNHPAVSLFGSVSFNKTGGSVRID